MPAKIKPYKNYSVWYKHPKEYSLFKGLKIPCYENGEPQDVGICLSIIKAKSWTEAKMKYEFLMIEHGEQYGLV
jgi:hypothetical protein